MEKEIKIVPPEGYEIDKENSTLECIKFKSIKKERWRDDKHQNVSGFLISPHSVIIPCSAYNVEASCNIFSTFKQVKSALAMARISQIMANDERFGGVVTDEEWKDNRIEKYVIKREKDYITLCNHCALYNYLTFHTPEQRDLFLKENEDLVRDYLML